jgi:hypothetical protein
MRSAPSTGRSAARRSSRFEEGFRGKELPLIDGRAAGERRPLIPFPSKAILRFGQLRRGR